MRTDEVIIENYEEGDLTYSDTGGTHVKVFNGPDYIADAKVYTDIENEKREYIVINHEIKYLDTLWEV